MSMLVFGATGQVATELQRRAPLARYLSRDQADLSDPDACAALIRQAAPSAIINAAAYTAVDAAEADEPLALRINGDAPAAMARAAAALDVPFVHISTDYVFDGSGTLPRHPEEGPAPCNAYGRTKLAGERGIAAAGGRFAILRTSWVVSAHGRNFLKTMLTLSETRDSLRIVDDQIGGPTPAGAIAAACLTIAEELARSPDKAGTYHFSGTPDTSWKGFAQAIFAAAGRDVAVHGIPTRDYPTPAARPLNSRLDCSATERAFGIARPDWRAALPDIIADVGKDGP
ncbi:dTDP-4-dehydrorhamnose reductase [Rhodovulum adriaticum]|uniref:dTDP-4-dehydrorhamnose reductase n=1 Tax=Rhodovulum adriaticum TaxID=35804 RepID=A0A4R2NZX5_RHOAD|nr:dTDP-4-dehydrorhamnose reductase [Rhodovulum adriaticum]MBK1636854.1 dTDP-4-dehydrorhamnose reductase [Rhodovulum adriaticum]TCP27338.1 dTDP-4-dehydrorhamnose reductase [Rhodovulum adriaticum]